MSSSSSGAAGGSGENMGPCGCPLVSFEGLGRSRRPTDGGPHWARTASVSSETEKGPGFREGRVKRAKKTAADVRGFWRCWWALAYIT